MWPIRRSVSVQIGAEQPRNRAIDRPVRAFVRRDRHAPGVLVRNAEHVGELSDGKAQLEPGLLELFRCHRAGLSARLAIRAADLSLSFAAFATAECHRRRPFGGVGGANRSVESGLVADLLLCVQALGVGLKPRRAKKPNDCGAMGKRPATQIKLQLGETSSLKGFV